MPGNDKDLKIGITADTSGADEAKRALEDVKKTGEEAGKATAEGAKEATKAVESLADAEKKAAEEAAIRAKNEKDYAEWREDSARKQEQYAKRRLELAAEEAGMASAWPRPEDPARAGQTSTDAPHISGNPMSMPSHLMGPQIEETTKAVEKQTEAIREQEEALAALTDEEAGVIDLRKKNVAATEDLAKGTKNVTEESKQLRSLLIGQGLAQAGELFGKMASGLQDAAGALKDVNPELAETAARASKITDSLSSVLSGAGAGFMFGGGAGAIIGGVTAALGELGAAWVESMAESEKGSKDFADGLERVRAKLAETAAERGKLATDQFRESIEKEADSYRRLNDEMADNIRLSQARRNARNEVENAKDAAGLAAINNNKDLSEADKIKQRAEIQSRADDRRAQDRLDAATERVKQAQADAATKAEAAKAAEAASAKAQQGFQASEARRDELKPRAQAKTDLDGANKVLVQAEEALQAAKRAQNAPDFSENGRSKEDTQALEEDVKKAEAAVEAAHESLKQIRSIAATEKEIAELRDLENGVLKELKKTLEDTVKKAGKAREEAAEAAKDRDLTIAIETEGAQGIIQARQLSRGTQSKTTEAQALQAADRKKQDDQRKADAAARLKQQQEDKATRERAGIDRGFVTVADRGEGIARKKLGDDAAEHFEKAKAALQDGASKEEIATLTRLLATLASLVDNKSADGSAIRELQVQSAKLQAEVTKLQGKQRNAPDITHNTK